MLKDTEAQFINSFEEYGFESVSELLSKALALLKKEFDIRNDLVRSAELYAEIYQEDKDLQELTDAAIEGWEKDERFEKRNGNSS